MCSWPSVFPGLLAPRREDHLGLAVVVEIRHGGLAREADAASRHVERPRAVLGLVEPPCVEPPVVGGDQDLEAPVVVEIGQHRVLDAVLDDVEVLRERPAARLRRGQHRPVEPAPAPARPVPSQDPGQMVEVARRIADPAVVDVARHHDLAAAVPVEVGDGRRAVREVRTVLGTAVREAHEIHRVVHVHAHARPRRGAGVAEVVVHRVRQDLVAVGMERGDVVRVGGGDDLLQAIVVQVRDGDVLVVHPGPGALLSGAARRPAGPLGPVGVEDVHLLLRAAAGASDDDLELAVRLQVLDRERAHLARRREGRRGAPDDLERGRRHEAVDVDLVAAAAHDDLLRAVAREVGDRDAGPHALRVGRAGAQRPAGALVHEQVVGAPDDFRVAVAVEIGHRGRRVPSGLAERPAGPLPLEDGRVDHGANGRHGGQQAQRGQGDTHCVHGGSLADTVAGRYRFVNCSFYTTSPCRSGPLRSRRQDGHSSAPASACANPRFADRANAAISSTSGSPIAAICASAVSSGSAERRSSR